MPGRREDQGLMCGACAGVDDDADKITIGIVGPTP